MEQKLRIIQVVNVRWFNATAWYGLFLSSLLKEAGHDVLVLGLPGTDSFARAQSMGLAPLGLPLNIQTPHGLVSLTGRLRKILREFRPHLVNCHRGEGMILWGLLKAAGYRFTLVRTRGDQRSPKANLPNRILHSSVADAVIATNSRTRKDLVDRLGLAPEAVSLVPGGADTRIFSRNEAGRLAVRKELGFEPEDLVIGLLGRLDPVKGQQELIAAVSRVCSGAGNRNARSRVRLLLACFPASHTLEQAQAGLAGAGLSHKAVVTGKRPDVTSVISAMDLGVVASLGSETIARAAFEIMACGVPLVGTDVGVMPDLLSSAALVQPGSSSALAGMLEKALLHDGFLDALRAEQGERMAHLTEKDFLRDTLAVYADALRKSPASP